MSVRLDAALSKLATARAATVDEFTLLTYADVLADVDVSLIERACFEMAKAPRADFEAALPSAGAIRAQAEHLSSADRVRTAAAKLLPMPKSEDDEPRYFCSECCDEPSGWRILTCPLAPCGRLKAHVPHPYAVHCHCWHVNPAVARYNQAHSRYHPPA